MLTCIRLWLSVLFYPYVYMCFCLPFALYVRVFRDEQESCCWYWPGAFQIQLLILMPIRSPIVVPLCPCRQHTETIASHLCNLQTSSICRISARTSAQMRGSLTCLAVSPGLQCGPQMCAADSFLYLSTQLCLIGPSTQTTVQSGSLVAGSFCSACLNRPHAWFEALLLSFFTLPVFSVRLVWDVSQHS